MNDPLVKCPFDRLVPTGEQGFVVFGGQVGLETAIRFLASEEGGHFTVKSALAAGEQGRTQRQYFPKGMDLSNVHQNRLNAVARRLNERPRETLNYETPTKRFSQCVASTG